MQGEGKRLHEQLSPPSAGIHPLSTPPPSLTTPFPLKKKKLLKVILKSPLTPNPNRFSPSLSSCPSSPPLPSPSSLSTPLLPPHHHHLQQHQLHHHQQLLLQQQHLHKQQLLQQQTQQLASELQLKLHQQHLLQQEHPKLLEQFKQQLQQEQIYDLQGNAWQSNDYQRDLRGQSLEQEPSVLPGRARSTQEGRRNALSARQRSRSREIVCDALSGEQCALGTSRFHSGEEANFRQSLQGDAQEPLEEFCPNGQEQSILQMQENLYEEREPTSKRLKFSEQIIKGNHHVQNSLRSPTGQGDKVPSNGSPHMQKPVANGILPLSRLASVSAPSETSWSSKLQDHGNSVVSEVPHTLTRPVLEGTRHRDGSATAPSSKIVGCSGNAAVPGRKLLRGILDKLQKKDSYGAFSEPVDPSEVPDYYDVIKEPMDFGTMRKRISSGFYTSLGLFEKDIFTICRNATTFNAAGTVYHRQARAIKVAAERILQPLKTPGVAGADEGPLNQKVGGPQVKKSHKKKQPSWTADYVSESVLNRGAGGRASVSYLAENYYVDWQACSGQTSNKMNTDDNDDAMGFSAKLLGLYEGRRFMSNEESRRGTYKPMSNFGSGSLVATVGGNPVQFVPAGFQLDFSYARSLARFAADLGPDVWEVAKEKIMRALPPGVPFGPGWVGQREAPTQSCPLPYKPLNQMPAATCRMDHQQRISETAGADDAHRMGNSSQLGGGFGATTRSDRIPLATDHRVSQTYVEECRSSEIARISQAETQAPLEAGVRQGPPTCDGDGEALQHSGDASLFSQGAREADSPPHCDGDVVLIPGRDLGGAGCVDYQNTHPSPHINLSSGYPNLSSTLISAPVTLIEGIQPRFNKGG